MMTYDNWKCDDSEREYRSRCDCCHKLKYGCIDTEFAGESWHVCPRCNELDNPRQAYVDPDHLREDRNDLS